MKTLAIELSTNRGSLAWFERAPTSQPAVAADLVREWPNDRKSSSAFFQSLQQAVQQCGLPERIIVGLGPGSYAGVRIAISAATGLASMARSQLVGYPSVAALATPSLKYAVIGDARRNSFFLAEIFDRTVERDFELLTEEALRERIEKLDSDIPVFSSDLLAQFKPRVEQIFPSAEILGQLAEDTGRMFSPPPLEPIYLRGPNVTFPKGNQAIRKI